MIVQVTMPVMGADMTEGTVVRWLKAEGDEVKRGDKLAEIETDKTVVEMESFNEGLLRKIVVPEGVQVPVGDIIAYLGAADDEIPETPGPPTVAGTPAAVATAAPGAVAAENGTATPGGRIKATPVARKLADERGIDLSQVTGTGPGGRITRGDVDGFVPSAAPAAPAPAAAPAAPIARTVAPVAAAAPIAELGEDVPVTPMRQTIANVTLRSKREQPHFYVSASIDMTEAMVLRKALNESLGDDGVHITVNDLLLKATVQAVRKFPKLNKFYEGERLVGHADINLGVAIALERGLIVPAIVRCQHMSLREISAAASDLGRRARGEGGVLTQEENTGATFSVSNLGMFDVENFAAIIVPPQAGILACGRVTKTPVVKDGEIVVADVLRATVSADHRVADGAEAAAFISEVKRLLENPLALVA